MKIAIGLWLTLLSLSIAAPAQDQKEARDLLKKVSDAYRSLSSYHFECLIVTESRSEGAGLKSDSRAEQVIVLAAARPNKKRAEVRSSYSGLVTVADGATKWVYLPAYNQYSKQATEKLPQQFSYMAMQAARLISMHSGLERVALEARILREEPINVGGAVIACIVVECKYPMSGSYTEPPIYHLWIDKTRGLVLREIRQFKASAMNGSTTTTKVTYTYNLVKANEPLPESLFVFSPPAGSKEVAELSIPGASRTETEGGALIGKEAIDFALKDLSGQEVSLKNLRGKVVLINFWASWCGPCRVEMPYLEKLHREFKGTEVIILGIDDERPEVAREFLKKNGYTFATLVDDRREVARKYRISGIPQVFVIGRDGKVVTHYVGAHSESDLRAALKKAGVGVQTTSDRQTTEPSSSVRGGAAQPQPCVPILLSPRAGDALDNGLIGASKAYTWEFAWTECPGAAEYHLYVIGPRASHPLIDDENIRVNSYRQNFDNGYVADPNLRGWKWKVRAKINGEWGEWSKTGTFDVTPIGSDSGSEGLASGQRGLSAPQRVDLSLTKVERESSISKPFTRYHLSITNSGDFPQYLFEPASDLPPCGLNKNSSRTWLEIYSDSGSRIYGYCGIKSAAELERISFGIADGQPTPGKVYVILIDRRLNRTYKSNLVSTKKVISPM